MVRAASRAERAANVPDRVGRFDLLLPIASGGMATVYLARARGHGGFERDVALKLTHAHLRESERFAAELIEEAKLAVRIRHANVVSVLDVGDDVHGVFLVMEYVEGESLAGLLRLAWARGSALSPRLGVKILLDALAGLHAAHELRGDDGSPLGLVHRDFSPQNILVGIDGVGRLADFGVAKAATRLGHTQTGLVKGKIAYMAPEQARDLPLDRRCDVWAAGVLAWELLAGRRLYGKKSDAAILLDLVSEPPPRLRSSVPDIPPALDDAVARALALAPDERWSTAQEFANAIISGCDGYLERPEPVEVAAEVEDLVGERLAERRRRATDLVRLRARVAEADASAESELESGSEVRSKRATGGSVAAVVEGAESTDTTSVSGAPRAFAAGRHLFGRARFVWAMSALLGGVAFLGWRIVSPARAPGGGAADADDARSTPVAAVATSAAPAEPPPAVEPAASPRDEVVVTANVAIASLQIGARIVPVPEPGTSVAIPRSALDAAKPVRVVARSVDGRRAEVVLDAAAESAAIAFSARGGPTVHAPPKGASSARLAKSPYEGAP